MEIKAEGTEYMKNDDLPSRNSLEIPDGYKSWVNGKGMYVEDLHLRESYKDTVRNFIPKDIEGIPDLEI